MRKKKPRCSHAFLVVFASALWIAAPPAAARKQPKVVPEAILFGNVFQEDGFSLRGARVVVYNADQPKKRKESSTDIQGEFAVRVPAGKARYTVEVSAPGFIPATKTVEVTADERVDMTFRLAPAKK
ncbi:MAG TPA: carboxypeptidase-like regulatory domain-containing protein [Bryobacterales bacterium]|nr:carboxypeptidase-like regulatory domain-containing protein [Bryobacterales bacterium]